MRSIIMASVAGLNLICAIEILRNTANSSAN